MNKERPTIAELEAILASRPEGSVQLAPDGGIRFVLTQDEIDAKRYRWLRSSPSTVRRLAMLSDDALDAAVDAAMQEAADSTTTNKG
ncbi:MAG: hypothetical protein ACYC2K_07325 [Gemmatimonadales bacterium]